LRDKKCEIERKDYYLEFMQKIIDDSKSMIKDTLVTTEKYQSERIDELI